MGYEIILTNMINVFNDLIKLSSKEILQQTWRTTWNENEPFFVQQPI